LVPCCWRVIPGRDTEELEVEIEVEILAATTTVCDFRGSEGSETASAKAPALPVSALPVAAKPAVTLAV
jgi:hypothetical protein